MLALKSLTKLQNPKENILNKIFTQSSIAAEMHKISEERFVITIEQYGEPRNFSALNPFHHLVVGSRFHSLYLSVRRRLAIVTSRSLVPEDLDRVDSSGPARRQKTCQQRHARDQDGCGNQCRSVTDGDPVEL